MVARFFPHYLLWGKIIFVRSIWFRNVLGMLVFVVFLFNSAAFPASYEIDVVRARIFEWRKAWQSRDIDAYMSFYSPSFHSETLDYMGWGLKKTEIFRTVENISVKISDLWVLIEGNRAMAGFVQHYEQAPYRDVGEKVLILVKADSTWKIVSEEWTPLNGYGKKRNGPDAPENSGKINQSAQEVSRPNQSKTIPKHPARPIAVENIDFE
ncbi:YybH family protein, partial [Thermodesulfobacteriota bacterium]